MQKIQERTIESGFQPVSETKPCKKRHRSSSEAKIVAKRTDGEVDVSGFGIILKGSKKPEWI